MRTLLHSFTCLLFLAFAAPGRGQSAAPSAEEAPIELTTLEITAHPSGADERTAAVWVVRPDATVAPTTTADLLAEVPGLHLDRAGGAGGRSTLYLRGGEENHTLVFLDGVPLNDPTNSRGGGVDFSLIDPAVIGSAAVVRGPASMRYGPDGISGVIHLDTGSRAAPGHVVALEGGGDDLARASFRSILAAGRDGDTVTLGGAWHTEEADARAGELDRTFLHAGYHRRGNLDLVVQAWHLEQDSDAFPDDSGGVRYAVLRGLEHRQDRQTGASLRLGQQHEEGSWSFSSDAAWLDARTVSPGVAPGARDPAGLPASVDDIRLKRYRAALVADRRVSAWMLAGGLDAAHEDGRDDAMLDFGPFEIPAEFAKQRDRFGAFVEGVGEVTDALTVSAGVRTDHFDDVGTHATGRVGVLGTLDAATQWRANIGTGFKAPSFYGLANPLVGNPDLKPERSRSIDAGLRRTFAGGNAFLDLSVFANELRNGVDFDPGPPPRVANLAEIRARGAELSGLWRASAQLHFSGAVTYMDARSQPDGVRMRSRPHWRGFLGASWLPSRFLAVNAHLTTVDAVPDSSIPTGDVRVAGWGRVDLAAVWTWDEHWSFTAACDNVLDREYEEIVGFVAPGRRLRFGVQARF